VEGTPPVESPEDGESVSESIVRSTGADRHARPATAPALPTAPGCKSLFAEMEPAPPKGLEVSEPPRQQLPRAEREAELKRLATRVAACTKCQELAATRTQTVFGVGNPEAKIMFIGEAPGADEDRQGEPFVGRAGRLLNDIIAACRLKREDVYICNILRCRPPENRTPTSEEAANCREFLDGQIAIVDPEYIVCWGSVAAQNLLDTKLSTGKLRGRFHTHGGAKVLCTYHPAYLLRNPDAKKEVWNDMKFLLREMGIDLSAK
jgi:DNA polymerase